MAAEKAAQAEEETHNAGSWRDARQSCRHSLHDDPQTRQALFQEAREKAKRLIQLMENEGRFDEASVVPGTDEYKAKRALEELCAIALGPSPVNERIRALAIILEFTKEKPATRNKLSIDKSEEWLLAVEADMKKQKPC